MSAKQASTLKRGDRIRIKDNAPLDAGKMGRVVCRMSIGVDIRVFNVAGAKDWLSGAEIVPAEGNEYGWLPTFKSIPILSVSALIDTLREYDEEVAEWFENSDTLRILQDVMRLTQKEYTD